jgi:hypothetical protein
MAPGIKTTHIILPAEQIQNNENYKNYENTPDSILRQFLKPNPEKPLWITDDEIKNLKLYVGTGGSKVWYLYYYDTDGKKASKKLGPADKLTVAQARMLAQDVGGRVIRGENVKKEKPAPKLTYGEFLQNNYEPWVLANRKTGRETMQIIRSTFGFLMSKLIAELSAMEIEQWRTKRIQEFDRSRGQLEERKDCPHPNERDIEAYVDEMERTNGGQGRETCISLP